MTYVRAYRRKDGTRVRAHERRGPTGVVLGLLVLLGGGLMLDGALDRPEEVEDGDEASVVEVIDGDTFRARLPGGEVESVRVVGIDTPESTTTTECGGQEATQAARRLLPPGAQVVLTRDPDQGARDQYGRLLAFVIIGEGTRGGVDYGQTLLEQGHARNTTWHGDSAHARYAAAEAAAQDADRGLWAACAS